MVNNLNCSADTAILISFTIKKSDVEPLSIIIHLYQI